MGKIKKVIMALVFLTIGCISVLASDSAVVEELRNDKLKSLTEYRSAIDEASDVSTKYTVWISSTQHTERPHHEMKSSELIKAITRAEEELNAYESDINIKYIPIGREVGSVTSKYLTYGIVSDPNNKSATLINPEDILKNDIKVNKYDSTRINNVKLENGEFSQTQVGYHIIAVVRGIDNYKNLIISQSTIQQDFNNAKFNLFEEKAYFVYFNNLKEPSSLIEAFSFLNASRAEIEKTMNPPVCGVCRKAEAQCICPPEINLFLVVAVGLGAVFFIVIVVIVICIFAFGKSKKCKKCGSALVKGKCPNCTINPPTCNFCGSKLGADGKCPNPNCPGNPPPPPPKCNLCGGILDANGYCTTPGCPNGRPPEKKYICRFCGQEASNLDIHEVGDDCGCAEETKYYCDKCGKVIPRGHNDCPDCNPIIINYGEETCIQADFGLKFVEPRKFADKYIAVPSRFVLGKNPKNEFGFVRAEMNLASYDEESKNTCSRNYVRFEESDDGFSVTLLSKNKLFVDGVQLKTDQVAQAKVGSRITLKPDWVLEVVKN